MIYCKLSSSCQQVCPCYEKQVACTDRCHRTRTSKACKRTADNPTQPLPIVEGVFIVPAILMLPTHIPPPDDTPESEDDASVCSFIPDDVKNSSTLNIISIIL